MKGTAKKYTYKKPRLVSSPLNDHSVQPEIYRRYISHIFVYYVFFTLFFSFVLNLFIEKIAYLFIDGSFNVIRTFMYFMGKEDEENKILYGISLIIFFSIIYFVSKKTVYTFTKPINKVEIEDGLILIKGSNVFEELEQAFNEMNEQEI